MTTDFGRVHELALSQVGVHEGRSDGHWNNIQKYSKQVPGLKWSDGQPWCATFVSWIDWKLGLNLYPHTASTDFAAAYWKKKGRWSEYPALGAQVLFGKDGDMNHTGIVIGYDDNFITTVEGNTNNTGSREGDGVYKMHHVRRDSRVQGYGYPEFKEGIVSADPKWQRHAPETEKHPEINVEHFINALEKADRLYGSKIPLTRIRVQSERRNVKRSINALRRIIS